jgi:predicted N-formylglutamate amidohydrolase
VRYGRRVIGLVLSCEHASWTLPPSIDLGVPDDVLRSQASWDPGAYEIAAALGEDLGLPVATGAFSRMWVDLNRPPDHPDVIPRTSYGAPVPGNAALTPGDRAARLAAYHAPYWDAVRRDVRGRLQSIGTCLHLSSHSFDPSLDPERRAFDLGVLYEPASELEADLANRLLFGLRAAGFAVRANQPYRGTEPALVTSLRAELAGQRYAGIELETSFAVVHAQGGCARVAAALASLLAELRDDG